MNEDQLKRSIIRLEAEVAGKDAEIEDMRAAFDSAGEAIAKLGSWLTLADNALLALEQGDNEAAHERLSRICAERMDGGWSPFDYPVQIKALKEEVAKLRDAPEPCWYQWVRSIIESHAPENHGSVREGECRCRWCLVWDAVGEAP